MFRAIAIGVVLLIASYVTGCSARRRDTSADLKIVSDPEGALATLSDDSWSEWVGDLFSSASIPIFRRKSCKTPCRVRLDRNEKVLVTFEMEGCEKAVATVYPIRAEAPGAGVILGSVIEGPFRLKPADKPRPVFQVLKAVLKCDEPGEPQKLKIKSLLIQEGEAVVTEEDKEVSGSQPP